MAAQYVLQLIVGEGGNGPVIRARHGPGSDQRVDHGFLNALNRRLEQRIEGFTAQALDLRSCDGGQPAVRTRCGSGRP